jgi:peptidyl-prolyl cis-trans isomerase A (cyclophilin A)
MPVAPSRTAARAAGAALTALLGACSACEAPERTPLSTDAGPGSSAPPYDPNWTRAPVGAESGRSRRAYGSDDPLAGRFDLAAATAELGPGDTLVASIRTSHGVLSCELFADRAPNTVAHFIGLANGIRPYKTASGWKRQPAYDGSSIDRVIPGLAISGGRVVGTDRAGPGFFLKDEPWPGMSHDRAGLLCTRGSGPDRVGSEFLITVSAAPHWDAPAPEGKEEARPRFTVFGACEPLEVIRSIAAAPSRHGRPQEHIAIERIRVSRR